jgi:hypothetical protein
LHNKEKVRLRSDGITGYKLSRWFSVDVDPAIVYMDCVGNNPPIKNGHRYL